MADDEMKHLLAGLLTEPPEGEADALPPLPDQDARLRRRALQLQTAAQVAAAATSILELDRLLALVVDLIRDHFGLYYVGIFLLEEQQEEGEQYARLVAATGRAGQQMMAAGHRLRVGGDSMVGWCLARGRARIALDVGREAVRFDNPYLPHTRSEMALPLRSRGRVIGAMTIQSDRPAAFAQDDITALQTMADQLANAIQNARLFEERERRITELSILNEIGRAVSVTLTMDALMEVVHLQVSRIFDTTNFYIATYEEGSDRWMTVFHIERGQQQPLAQYSIEAGLTGYIIRRRRPLLFRSAQEVLSFLEEQGTPPLGEMARSWLGVPLLVADRLVGVMAIQSYEQDSLYDDQDLALFSTIAAQVANAIDNARLFQERERQIKELAILDQIRQAISRHLELDQLLETVYEQVQQIMPVDAFFLTLYDAQTGYMTYPLVYDQGKRYDASPYPLSPRGYLARVIESGDSYLLNRTAEELATMTLSPEQAVGDEEKPSASLLFVPLISGRETIGVLSAQSYRLNAYDQKHVALLRSIADQTAIAIERARLFEEIRTRAEELAVLNEIGQTIVSVLDLDVLLRQIVDTIKERFGHYFVGILLIEGDELVFRSGSFVGDSDIRWEQGDLRLALDGYGLNVAAATEGQPVLVNDVSADSRYGTVGGLEPVQAELDVPIKVKGRVIGTLTVQSDRLYAFDQADVSLMQSLANQAGIAIENARLFERTQAALAESEALYRATQAISEPLELELLVESLVKAACQLTAARYGVVLTLDPETRATLHFKTYGVDLERFPMHRMPVGKGLLGTVLAGRTIRVSDISARDGAPQMPHWHFPVRAVLGVPLFYGEEVRGLVMVGEPLAGGGFDERDERVLTSFATQAAIAIENRRLFEQIQNTLRKTEALYQAGRLINAAQSLDDILVPVLNYVQTWDVDRCLIALLDDPEAPPPRRQAVVEAAWDRAGQENVFRGGRFTPEQVPMMVNLSADDLLVIPDMAATEMVDEQTRATFRLLNVGAAAVIPLAVGKRLLGWLLIETVGRPGAFPEQGVEALRALAGQMAVAIQNLRSLEEIRLHAEELAVLNELGQALTARLSVREVLEETYRQASRLVDTSNFFVAFYHPERREFTPALARITESEADKRVQAWPADEGFSGYLLRHRTSLLLSDNVEEQRKALGIHRIGAVPQSWLGVPLIVGDRVLGTMAVASFTRPGLYTEHDRELLTAIANTAAIAIQNARLLEEAQARAERERLARAITDRVRRAASREVILQTTLAELGQMLQATTAVVHLGTQEQLLTGQRTGDA